MKKELEIKNGVLYYNNVNLEKIAKEYGTPLRITFLDIIKTRVESLKKAFDDEIKKQNYQGKFIYVNANKANYESLEIEEAVKAGDGIETSSYYDLVISKKILNKIKQKDKPIYSNGYKEKAYLEEVVKTCNEGYNIIAIIDSKDEYEFYKKANLKTPLKVGLRIHLQSLYHEEDDIILNDRFGLMKEEFECIIEDISEFEKLTLTTIHFHQRGFDFDENKFIKNIIEVFEKYYVPIAEKFPTLINFDIGGGTPLLINDDFDYSSFSSILITTISKLARKYHVSQPNIISENGKYSQKDSTVNIYEVVGYKKTGDYPWYLINGSLLIAMPEHYALGEEILVTPINNLNEDMEKARIGSITCDCDDIFYNKNTGYILLPKENKKASTFIGIIGTGSYQSSMSGKGGVHHCLLPEELDLLVYSKNGKQVIKVRKTRQSLKDIEKLIKLDFKK